MAGTSSAKAAEKIRNQAASERMKKKGSRALKFTTEGFPSNMSADQMNLSTAMSMASRNKGKIQQQKPEPIYTH